ncbi:MAG TPA: HEPN domain-containing protein [Candidatus Acetothermia bacterium]|nr:HEPN domain-containing protein [Candidatus Acetothermia bacterium]
MNSHDAAQRGVKRAMLVLEEARDLQRRSAWNLVVRRSQEAVELALKSALWWAGLEVPRIHDVGPVLKQNAKRFPKPFSQHIDRLALISRALRAERETSFYGNEQSGVPPEELYTKQDAQEAPGKAQQVIEDCHALVHLIGDA